MAEDESQSDEPKQQEPKLPLKKTHAWIFDATGIARKGWLQIVDDGKDARPADKGWRPMAAFPRSAGPVTRVLLWADDVDKYIGRIDIGGDRRWIIMEGLPAFLTAMKSLNALVQMGGATGGRRR